MEFELIIPRETPPVALADLLRRIATRVEAMDDTMRPLGVNINDADGENIARFWRFS